ncbi:MAG TPA: CDP-alcohol phosphatidyltransferase family protein [Polyangiaceae bacterium]|nr:CDP-alcohol phosphatidyltransferase family protein [Polyangiaceae bacterium]
MTTLEPQAALAPSLPVIAGPAGWKRRLEDPFNTYYRYPVALWLVKYLVKTPITPNQVSLIQPVFAAGAGYLLTLDDYRAHLGAALLFELRSILDCADGSLARAKKMASPNGHAIDAMADWLGVVLLYVGVFHYLWFHAPTGVSHTMAMTVVCFALAQGAIRSFAFDYFKNKYLGIYERATDEVPEILRSKVLGLCKGASFFAHVDVFIMRTGHLFFELEWFDPKRSRPMPADAVERMSVDETSPKTKLMGFLWSISGGDAFLSFVILSIVAGQLWAGQVFFATVGCLWIFAVVVYNVLFLRSYRDEADA